MNPKIIIRPQTPRRLPSPCRELILIDSAPIKRKEQSRCQEIYRKLEAARIKVEQHESKSVPEYQQWMRSNFGKELTEMREITQKLVELKEIVDAVYDECMMNGCSERKAYEKIMRMKHHFEEVQKEYEAKQKDKASDKGDTHSGSNSDEFSDGSQDHFHSSNDDTMKEEMLRAAFEMFFGTQKQWRSRRQSYEDAFEEFKENFDENDPFNDPFGDPFSDRNQNHRKQGPRNHSGRRHSQDHDYSGRNHHHSKDSSAQARKAQQDSRIKELYRQLARRLHPDLNPGLEAKKTELWHQVQEAYTSNQLARLETLAALSHMFDSSWDKVEGVSTLKNLFKELTSTFKQIEKKLKLARKDLAWNFHEKMQNPVTLDTLKKSIEKELHSDYRDLVTEHREIEALIQEWSTPRKARAKRQDRMTTLR